MKTALWWLIVFYTYHIYQSSSSDYNCYSDGKWIQNGVDWLWMRRNIACFQDNKTQTQQGDWEREPSLPSGRIQDGCRPSSSKTKSSFTIFSRQERLLCFRKYKALCLSSSKSYFGAGKSNTLPHKDLRNGGHFNLLAKFSFRSLNEGRHDVKIQTKCDSDKAN